MSTPTSELTVEELARAAGETTERILEWRAAGLLGSERVGAEDVECVRLIQFCLRRGFDVATIANAEREQPGFLRQYVAQLHPSGLKPTCSPAEAAAMTGVDADLIRKLREISGSTPTKDSLDEDDLQAIRGWKVALDHGLPEEALLQLVRVYADNLGASPKRKHASFISTSTSGCVMEGFRVWSSSKLPRARVNRCANSSSRRSATSIRTAWPRRFAKTC